MRNWLTGCLLAGLTTASLAQGNVQVYGVVDLGVVKGNGGASANAGANGTNNSWQMKQASASRLGFRGTEDLGGGLQANFLLEHRFNPDTGSYGSQPFFMQSTVSLGHRDWGSLWMGRDYMPAFWVAIKADPFGMDGVGQIGSASMYADFASASDNASRTNNAIGVRTKRWNGWSFDAAYAMQEDAQAPQSGMNLQYQGSQLYAGLGFAKKNHAAASTPVKNDQLINAALIYRIDGVRVMGHVAQAENKPLDQTTRQYMVGLDAKLGNGRLKFAFTRVNSDLQANDRKKLGIGYDYHLSKSTRIYADWGIGQQKNKSTNSALALGVRQAF